MNFERLEKLITALEGADPADFDMDTYGHRCGTPACVLGHFAARTDLQDIFLLVRATSEWHDGRPLVQTTYGWSCDIDGTEVCGYFGISQQQAFELFGPYKYEFDEDGEARVSAGGCGGAKTPLQAIAFLRKFIDTHKGLEDANL